MPTKVFTNGCFDVLHVGHIHLLKEAASLGNWLVVGINSDDSVRRLKGDTRPINNEKDRATILRALIYVNEVIIFNEDTPYKTIEMVKPDIIVKGGDYTEEQVIGNDLAKVVIVPFLSGYSSTKIINSL